LGEVKVIWDLTKPLPRLKTNKKITVKPVGKNHLIEVGKILVITWGGFIKNPETTVKWVSPKMEAGLEQPFIAYVEPILSEPSAPYWTGNQHLDD